MDPQYRGLSQVEEEMDVRSRELSHSTSNSPDCSSWLLLQIQVGNGGIPNHILLFGGHFCSFISSKAPRTPKPQGCSEHPTKPHSLSGVITWATISAALLDSFSSSLGIIFSFPKALQDAGILPAMLEALPPYLCAALDTNAHPPP